ncbi:MAG: transporter [Flavobacteriales bacterium]|nr:transporter [Flavobacteriales bacterium]|tara:strand:+ start:843 stop:1256 length:414 start_codon:yes stop_codon:yes gene_type:complete
MKNLKYLVIGTWFGILLTKSEAVSWFRIQEMFRFQAFHMYGIIGMAVVVGMISLLVIKKFKIKSLNGEKINPAQKPLQFKSNLIGGFVFGLGWALTGACPGPIYALIGNGLMVFVVVLTAALIGSIVYDLIKKHLPH